MEELRNIFVSSCVEMAARKVGCSTGEMYRRMKRVDFIRGFIMPGYEVLHTQSREHVTEDVLGALKIWERNYQEMYIRWSQYSEKGYYSK